MPDGEPTYLDAGMPRICGRPRAMEIIGNLEEVVALLGGSAAIAPYLPLPDQPDPTEVQWVFSTPGQEATDA